MPDAPIPDPDTPAPVRFLPEYDNVVLSHDDRSRIIDADDRRRVLTAAFESSFGIVLVDGFARGTWRMARQAGRASLRIGLLDSLSESDLDRVTKEGDPLLASSSPMRRPVKSSFSLCPPPNGHLSTREPSVERNVDKLVDITPSGCRAGLLPFGADA